jgi:hypothetical protein
MRNDLPPDLVANIQALPPGLREAAEKAIDLKYPTVESDAAERRERERQQRREDAELHRELASKVERALEGEWGDDVRRAVDELTRQVRAQVLVLADWAKRARKREPLTKIEFVTARQAVDATAVRYALAATKKIIGQAERERKAARP